MNQGGKKIFGAGFLAVILAVGLFVYLSQNRDEGRIVVSGEVFYPAGLTINENETLIVKAGSILNFGENSRLLIKGRILAEGENGNEIVFKGDNNYWGGIRIEGSSDAPDSDIYKNWLYGGDNSLKKEYSEKLAAGNIFKNCVFQNISTVSREFAIGNKWKASIEAYDSAISVENSKFEDILYIGGILVQRSYIAASKNIFSSDTIHKDFNATDNSVGVFNENKILHDRKEPQRCADGVWIKNSSFLISNNEIKGNADDGVDADESFLVIYNNDISNALDDGIDVDSKSFAYLIENSVKNIPGSAILVSDETKAVFSGGNFSSSDEGLVVRDGAKVAAKDLSLSKNKKGVFVYEDFPCALSSDDFEFILDKISSMSDDEVSNLKIDGVLSGKDLIDAMRENYKKELDTWYLSKNNHKILEEFKLLKEIFKIVDISEIEYIFDDKTKKNPTCNSLKNSLFMTNSVFSENERDFENIHRFSINLDGVVFSDEVNKNNAMEDVDRNFSCSLVDETNASNVKSNSEKILRSLQ